MNNDKDIEDLLLFFENAKPITGPIHLDKCTIVINVPVFINSHTAIVKAQKGKPRYQPYLDRLITLKTIIEKKL